MGVSPPFRRLDPPTLKHLQRSIEYQDSQRAIEEETQRGQSQGKCTHRKREVAKEFGNLGMDILDEVPGITG